MRLVERITRGTVLVASPLLRDPNFDHTVVLLCEHEEGGSWGLVLNRRTELTFGDLLDDVPFPAASRGPVHWGGPVETSRMQVLHHLRQEIPGTLELLPGVALGLESEAFRDIAAEERLADEALHAYVGHAGWAPEQLDEELATGSWIMCTASPRLVFDTDPKAMWESTLRALGPEYARLTQVPTDPRLN